MNTFKLKVMVKQEGSLFVATCPEFGVSSQGSDEYEACVNVFEGLALYFITAKDMGFDFNALEDRGCQSTS